jgi:hypothetical protein
MIKQDLVLNNITRGYITMVRLSGSSAIQLVLHELTGLLFIVSIFVLLHHAKDLVDVATSLQTA